MTWTFTDSLPDFRAATAEFLTATRAENTVLLTLVHNLAHGSWVGGDPELPPRFGWWSAQPGGAAGAAWIQTRPQPLRLSGMPAAVAAELARALPAAARAEITSVGGPDTAVTGFAEAWTARFGHTAAVRENLRLYRLGELEVPEVPGRARAAGPEDFELLVRWWREFAAEVGATIRNVEGLVRVRLETGDVRLWEDGGRPVSLAAASAVVAGMVRVAPVYTPAAERGHGYGSAATAAVSARAALRGAEEVLLYTDLANPVSNSIYQKLGYRPLHDNLVMEFQE
ncbi:GNAT family N-acetyltransferase [Kitasatospora sp. LaBMicrA B282]|uniref:GNAT family N-acetyltransferase n=1 Tax=Kitasatospora sp. LaBMicrA B282 TaxID=3420949 RepID=UPI003D0A13AA